MKFLLNFFQPRGIELWIKKNGETLATLGETFLAWRQNKKNRRQSLVPLDFILYVEKCHYSIFFCKIPFDQFSLKKVN